MNMNGMLGQFGRILTRRLMNWAIDKGIDAGSRRSGGTSAPTPMTPAARKQAQASRQAVKRARKAAQTARRMGR